LVLQESNSGWSHDWGSTGLRDKDFVEFISAKRIPRGLKHFRKMNIELVPANGASRGDGGWEIKKFRRG
jgi:hypothetical protein